MVVAQTYGVAKIALANSPHRGEIYTMIKRRIEARIRAALTDTPVVLLNGARQTGKTTLVQSLAKSRGAEYLTLDDASTLALASKDPQGFVKGFTGAVVIDEIQKAPQLLPAIKLEVDRQREAGRFLLTGSANALSLPQLSESLAGRMEIIPLHPFSQGEIEESGGTFIDRLFGADFPRSFKGRFEPLDMPALLLRGGFPEAIQRKDPTRRAAWFGSYISTILQRDVQDLARIDGLAALPNLLNVLAARSSGLLNMADLARDAALSHTTLTRYLSLLEALLLVYRLPAWSANIGKRLTKAPKVHLCDTGLAGYLLGMSLQRLRQEPLARGRLVESFVVGELRKQASWATAETSLLHYRTAAGTEVDVVLENREGLLAGIEVKAAASVSADAFAPLIQLSASVGARFHAGIVLYQGEQVLPFGERLVALPIAMLWQEGGLTP